MLQFQACFSIYAEVWREIYVKAPKGPFRIVATDENKTLWFGFAAPRTVGKLSMLAKKIRHQGHQLWQIGLILLMLALLKPMIALIKPRPSTPSA